MTELTDTLGSVAQSLQLEEPFSKNSLKLTANAPENRPLEKEDSYWKPSFLGAFAVSWQGG